MTHKNVLFGTTAIFVAFGGAAMADVTANDVWANMTNVYSQSGYEITPGSVTEEGGTITVSDLQVTMINPYAEMADDVQIDAKFSVDQIVLTGNSDGTVTIDMSDQAKMVMEISEDGETGTFGMTVHQPDMVLKASGEPGMVNYRFSGPSMELTLDTIDIPGEEISADMLKVGMTMGAYSGEYDIGSGDLVAMNINMEADSADISFNVDIPEEDAKMNMAMSLKSLVMSSEGTYTESEKPGDITAMLRAGMSSVGSFSHGGSSYSIDFADGRDAFKLDGSAASGAVSFSMDAEGMAYEVSNTQMDMVMSASDIPLPEVSLSASATAFGLIMPVLASETAQDMGMTFRLEGLSVSDMIWSMIDPGEQLPRDPATIIMVLSGKANWLIDIMDPMAIEQADVEMPGALESLNIDKLEVALAGAELTGSGGFTFDMSDLATFDGLPAPTGSLDLMLSGSNALMDKLVAMGLLPQEQAMGARMMMGMFAEPAGEDILKSKIEIDGATGGISANGMRLQ